MYYALFCVAFGGVLDYRQPQPKAAIAFPDAGSKRLIAVAQPNGAVIWRSDDGPINENMRLWTIEPIQRTVFAHSGAAVEVPTMTDSIPMAELFTWQSDTVIVWNGPTQVRAELPALPADISQATAVVLRANTPTHHVRQLINRLAPRFVLFAGGYPRARHPDQWLARWRALYPRIEFMSALTHGGVRLEWSDSGLRPIPTIDNPVWIDPDLE
jgi:hypothetical protein